MKIEEHRLPTGSQNIRLFNEQKYKTFANDPQYDPILYGFVFTGDMIVDKWSRASLSGMEIGMSYRWTSEGNFEIRVKARDIHGFESEWSDPLPITVSKSKSVVFLLLAKILDNYPIIQRLLKI